MTHNHRCIVILGPTAGGKSSLAFRLALKLNGVVIGADSMQIYRHMNAGTAKPSCDMRNQIPHAMIDIVEPTARFTVAEWLIQAHSAIRDAHKANLVPIVVGGTNLYVKALLEGLFDGPAADPAFRAPLSAVASDELHARLKAIDATSAERIHHHDRRRIIRALEVHTTTGRPISQWQCQWDRHLPATAGNDPANTLEFQLIGLSWSREAINRRINQRVSTMFFPQEVEPQAVADLGMTESLPEEIRRLLEERILGEQSSQALGYKQVINHFLGTGTLDDAFEQTKIQTRRFAKQQRTWLRRFREVHWIQGDRANDEDVSTSTIDFLSC